MPQTKIERQNLANSAVLQQKQYTITGALEVVTGNTIWITPYDITMASVQSTFATVPTGANVVFRLVDDNVTVATFSTNSASFSNTMNVNIDAGSKITVDITQVGTTNTGWGFTASFSYYHRTT